MNTITCRADAWSVYSMENPEKTGIHIVAGNDEKKRTGRKSATVGHKEIERRDDTVDKSTATHSAVRR